MFLKLRGYHLMRSANAFSLMYPNALMVELSYGDDVLSTYLCNGDVTFHAAPIVMRLCLHRSCDDGRVDQVVSSRRLHNTIILSSHIDVLSWRYHNRV